MPRAQALKHRPGVCPDFAHVMIDGLRSRRLGARYVSGYLRGGAKFQGAEVSHAPVAACVPGAGWLRFYPMSDVVPAEGHVKLRSLHPRPRLHPFHRSRIPQRPEGAPRNLCLLPVTTPRRE